MLDNLNNSKHEFNLYKQIFLNEDLKNTDLIGPSLVANQKITIHDFREPQIQDKFESRDNLSTSYQESKNFDILKEETGKDLDQLCHLC